MDTIRELFAYKGKEEFLKTWYRERNFLTAAHLKYIAIFTMLISHISQTRFLESLSYDYLTLADTFTLIGRIAMPLFCFFTVQAVVFTKDIKKYFTRMLIFALVTEIPFDLAFWDMPVFWYSQNVIFTLLIGAVAIYAMDLIWQKEYNPFAKLLAFILVGFVATMLANLMMTDYGGLGVLAIILIYLARNNKILTALAMLYGFKFEFMMPGGYFGPMVYGFVYLSIPLIMLYNAQRGKQNKWLFYIFYPAHLLILYLLRTMI